MLDQSFSYAAAAGSRPGVTILTLTGPLTIGNIFALQAEMRTLKPPCLILDLTHVPYMDSAGLGVLMNAFVSAQGDGRKLLLANVNQRVLSLFEMTRVESILPIFPSVQTAEAQA
ncbi:MAG: STAS domain-containing protein [Acidobacteriota bacterium]|nr:STAS domain-containing protein [Acidobacteriota bacterium]